MKFTTNSKVLTRALESVEAAIKQKTTLPIATCILLERDEDDHLRLAATNLHLHSIVEHLKVQFAGPPPERPARIAVPASYLLKTMRSLGDESVTFEYSDSFRLTITTERGQYVVSGFDGGDFPAIPGVDPLHKVEIERDLLLKAIATSSFAIGQEPARLAMTGFLFQLREDGLYIVATDSHRLVRFKVTTAKCEGTADVVVPGAPLKTLGRLSGQDTCTLKVSKHHVCFDFGTASLTAARIDAPFPKYERVVSLLKNERRLTVNRMDFLAAVQRTALFAGTTIQQIRVDVSPDSMKVSAEDLERSHSAFETIPCEFEDSPEETGKLTLAFNARYLAGVLQNIDSDDVIILWGKADKAGIVHPTEQIPGADLFMLVMPIALNRYA